MFQTTLTQWAFLYDCLLFASFFMALSELGLPMSREDWRVVVLWTLFVAHYLFAKTVKLIPYLLRNPADFRFLPVSVLFGYFHNLIKFYGFVTVKEVSRPPLFPLALSFAELPRHL